MSHILGFEFLEQKNGIQLITLNVPSMFLDVVDRSMCISLLFSLAIILMFVGAVIPIGVPILLSMAD
jgi:hypothetical protein